MLELRSITKSYTTASLTQTALNDVSVAFRDNEFVAILGQSGSGKTTMLNVIGGLDHFDAGDLVIDGISTHDYRPRDWDSYRNNRIGFVFQSYNLIPHQSVLSNVELALTLSGVSRSARRERALNALTEVGLADHVHKRPSQLSGGQMQRVAIARALVNDPEILLADEPTGALDSTTSLQVMDLLREVARDRLVIMVTHNPNLAHEYATRIVELADGRITADSKPFIPGTEDVREAKPTRKTSMSLLTALSLSGMNLWTKKGRTLMTSFAGSIGIIGIAAILALANGVNAYIAKTEEDALTSYPLTIQRTGMDMASMMSFSVAGSPQTDQSQSGASGQITTRSAFTSMMDSTTTNDLKSLKSYFDADGGNISDHVAAIEYNYDVQPQIYLTDTSNGVVQVNPEQSFSTMTAAYGSGAFSSFVTTDAFHQLPESRELYDDAYTVLAGQWPTESDELVLIVDSNGSMQDLYEYALGLRDHSELDEMMEEYYSGSMGSSSSKPDDSPQSADASRTASYDYENILGTTFSLVNATDRYVYDETYKVWTDKSKDSAHMKDLVANGTELTIVAIVKPLEEDTTILTQGIGYTAGLTRDIMKAAAASDIVAQQIANPTIDVFTGKSFEDLTKEAESSFDMSSLFTVDGSKLQAAFRIDPSALQMDLSGLDFSGISASSLDIGSLDMSGMDLSALDASQLAGSIDLSTLDLSSLDLSDLAAKYPQLADIDYAMIISRTLKDGVIAEGAGEYLSTTLTGIVKGFTAYYSENADSDGDGIPDVDAGTLAQRYLATPEVRQTLNSLITSGKVINTAKLTSNLATALGEDPAVADIAASVSQRLATTIGTHIATQLGQALSGAIGDLMSTYMTQTLSTVMTQFMTTLQTQIGAQLTNAMTQMSESLASAFTIDESAFAEAFTSNMNADDLASLMSTMMSTNRASYDSNLRSLGWGEEASPSQISIYPTTFEDKDAVKAILDNYNQAKRDAGFDDQVITYTDFVGLLMSSVTSIINIISWMLIAFVSISLVVSSIMIAIITFISVLERKKEIGILRAIGASRRDVSHVFNAETVIEGFLAGVIGIAITLGLCVVANAIVSSSLGVENIAQLPPAAAVILIAISVVLTLIAGVIPAGKAAREDPVEALRSE
ncbi:ABC transporter ATP-binding protein/permease [Actinomyces mediterranea]|uniref:ABC transporter ATP-binding protein/permease n=1 Tax=Actinomyces mediterranea TaxID=1871028 RepID=UPI000970CAC5|nr:ABC transporter ATP-binding protein/permease [Actinomyces mediterranea]